MGPPGSGAMSRSCARVRRRKRELNRRQLAEALAFARAHPLPRLTDAEAIEALTRIRCAAIVIESRPCPGSRVGGPAGPKP